MTTRLLKAAEAFLMTGIWEEIDEDYIFAVWLTNGETGFVSLCGPEVNGGKGLPESGCASLELYLGEDGIETMLDAHVYSDVFDKSEFAGLEKYFSKKCLIVAASEEGEPRFIKAAPYRSRQEITDESEKNLLYEALLAAVSIAKNGCPVDEVSDGEEADDEEIIRIPIYKKEGEGFTFSKFIDLPEPYAELEVGGNFDDNAIEMLMEIPQDGSWECEMIFVPEAKAGADGEPSFFEHMIMLVNNSTGASLVSEPFKDYKANPEKAGEALLKLLELRKVRPEAIIARDDRTFELLEPLCRLLDIDLSETEELPILDAVQNAILHQDKEAQKKAEEEFEKFIDSLCEIPDEAFNQLPSQVLDEVKVLLEMGVISGEKAKKIRKRL